jgi:hypothetical protein
VAGIHKTLQDDNGGYLIDHIAMLCPGATGFVEDAVCLRSGQALVPEVDGKFRLVGQQLRKDLGFLRLTALVTGKMKWVADDDLLAAVSAGEPGQRPQVLTGLFADQREHGLRSETEAIRNSDADAAVSYVQPHEARHCILLHESILRGN